MTKADTFLKSLNPGWVQTKNLFVDSTYCCLANHLLKNHNGSKTTKKVAVLKNSGIHTTWYLDTKFDYFTRCHLVTLFDRVIVIYLFSNTV